MRKYLMSVCTVKLQGAGKAGKKSVMAPGDTEFISVSTLDADSRHVTTLPPPIVNDLNLFATATSDDIVSHHPGVFNVSDVTLTH